MPDAKWYSTHVFHSSSPRFRGPLLLRRQNIHEFNALFAFDWTKPGATFKWPAELVHWSVTSTKLISCNEGHPLLLYREAKRDMESIFGKCSLAAQHGSSISQSQLAVRLICLNLCCWHLVSRKEKRKWNDWETIILDSTKFCFHYLIAGRHFGVYHSRFDRIFAL